MESTPIQLLGSQHSKKISSNAACRGPFICGTLHGALLRYCEKLALFHGRRWKNNDSTSSFLIISYLIPQRVPVIVLQIRAGISCKVTQLVLIYLNCGLQPMGRFADVHNETTILLLLTLLRFINSQPIQWAGPAKNYRLQLRITEIMFHHFKQKLNTDHFTLAFNSQYYHTPFSFRNYALLFIHSVCNWSSIKIINDDNDELWCMKM